MKKITYILAISALFAATNTFAFDYNKAIDDHKDLAKQQMLEKMVSEKTTDDMINEHTDLAKSHFSDTSTEAKDAIEASETANTVSETVDKVNTIKSWLN